MKKTFGLFLGIVGLGQAVCGEQKALAGVMVHIPGQRGDEGTFACQEKRAFARLVASATSVHKGEGDDEHHKEEHDLEEENAEDSESDSNQEDPGAEESFLGKDEEEDEEDEENEEV